MTPVFEARLDLPSPEAVPDSYSGSAGTSPPDNFVVSRYADGTAASVYASLSWNWTPYAAHGRSSMLNFRFWDAGEPTHRQSRLLREIHWFMFLLIWKRQGPTFSYQTLLHYLKLFRAMAKFCDGRTISVQAVLTNQDILLDFLGEATDGQTPKTLAAFLSILTALGSAEVGFRVLGSTVHGELRARALQYDRSLKQHAPLPTRIYSSNIAMLAREVSDFEAVMDRYFTLVTKCANDPVLGRCESSQYRVANRLSLEEWGNAPAFGELLVRHNLMDYFETKELQQHVKGLSRGLYEIQLAIRLMIHTFSGMRDEEVASLPYACIETLVSGGKTHYVITGKTTKLNQGKIKRTRWVTSREGYRAILLAQKIADLIFQLAPEKATGAEAGRDGWPLFVSPVYLGLAGRASDRTGKDFLPSKLDLSKCTRLRQQLQPLIEESDLRELEQIDPHRAWRSEAQFQIGTPWTLTSHHMRRSLALYAQRSGLVSLPSLRRQLQHITEEMSRYYARGSTFAKDFIGEDKQHFGREWQETQPVSAALSYLLNVLLSDDVLFGGHANWVDHRLRSDDGTVAVDREATLRRFKKGELSYRETSLGGCTNTENCDQIAIKWLDVDCLGGCRNLVGRLSKLERVIVAQTRLVEALDPASLEFRTEKSDLDILIATRDNVRRQHDLSTEPA